MTEEMLNKLPEPERHPDFDPLEDPLKDALINHKGPKQKGRPEYKKIYSSFLSHLLQLENDRFEMKDKLERALKEVKRLRSEASVLEHELQWYREIRLTYKNRHGDNEHVQPLNPMDERWCFENEVNIRFKAGHRRAVLLNTRGRPPFTADTLREALDGVYKKSKRREKGRLPVNQ